MKRALALIPLFACVGCVTAQPPVAANLDTLALSAAAQPASRSAKPAAQSATPSGASVQLPTEAARVAGVERRWQAHGYSERVRLTTDAHKPESRIDLAIQTRGGTAPTPSDETIRSELAREFPGVPMMIAPDARYQNAYGDFRLAIGRSGDSLRCIYVWQSIEDARQSLPNGDRLSGKSSDPAPASLHMKLCRSDMTVDQLADAASHVEIALPDHPEKAGRRVASNDSQEARADPIPRPMASVKRRAPAPRVALASPGPPLHVYAPAPAFAPVPAGAAEGQRFGAQPAGSSSTYTALASSYAAAPSAAPVAAAPARTFGGAYDLPPEAFAGPSGSTQR